MLKLCKILTVKYIWLCLSDEKCHNIRHAMTNNSKTVAQHTINMKGTTFINMWDLLWDVRHTVLEVLGHLTQQMSMCQVSVISIKAYR
jgi:hypothetical protein